MDSLGFDWEFLDVKLKSKWETVFSYLKKYAEENGDCFVPANHITEDGKKLGTWVTNTRNRKDILSPEQIDKLDSIGFVWNSIIAEWEKKFSLFEEYVQEKGHGRVPTNYMVNGLKLGNWITIQRKNRDILSPERKARLDALGFDWDPQKTELENNLYHFENFVKKEGHGMVPSLFKTDCGHKLGGWVHNIRSKHKKGQLSLELKNKLDSLGFIWEVK